MWNYFEDLFFKLILGIDLLRTSYEIGFRWLPMICIDDKWTMVQAKVWHRQATIHYLNRCWPRSREPYGVTRPQCGKLIKFIAYIDMTAYCNYFGDTNHIITRVHRITALGTCCNSSCCLGLAPGPDPILLKKRNIFISAVGRSFHERCFPSDTIHLAISANSLHHLSERWK